jgi:hypothetical protein
MPDGEIVQDVVIGSNDGRTAYVITTNRVYQVVLTGPAATPSATFTNLTSTGFTPANNLDTLAGGGTATLAIFHTIAFVPHNGTPPGGPNDDGIVVGTDQGVFVMKTNQLGYWVPLGAVVGNPGSLPNVPVWDMQFVDSANVLVIGTLGHGVWELPNAGTYIRDIAFQPLGTISGTVYVDANDDGVRDGTITSNVPITYAPEGAPILPAADDASTGAIPLGFTIDLFGTDYSSFYINNNGNVSFGGPITTYTDTGFPLFTGFPMIAPFFADVDTRGVNSGVVHYTSGIANDGNKFVQVDWDHVGYFDSNSDQTDTFTLYIENDPTGTIIAFKYGVMQWTTGDANGGFMGFGGLGAQIGFDSGDGTFFSFGRPNSPATLAPFTNTQLVFQLNGSGELNNEPGQLGTIVYVDANGNGSRDPNEEFTTSDADGNFTLTSLAPGTYSIGEDTPANFVETQPAPPNQFYSVTVNATPPFPSGFLFGNAPLTTPNVTLDISPGTIDEDGGTATLTVALSSRTPVPTTVTLRVGGTATLGDDYEILDPLAFNAPVAVNPDGTFDVTVPANSTAATFTILALADGTPEALETVTFDFVGFNPSNTQANFIGPSEAEVGIVDADSSDVAVVVDSPSQIAPATPNTGFSINPTPVNLNSGGGRPDYITTADVNGDGTPEILVLNTTGNSISIIFNPTGPFPVVKTYSVGATPTSVIATDLNGDGNLDLAITTTGGITILQGDGAGGFTPASGYIAGTNPVAIAAGDFNGDGFMDLAIANSGSNNVTILFGNGNFTFRAPVTYSVGSTPMDIKAADLNHDGALDLVVANQGPGANSVTILFNNGSGAFTESTVAAGIQPQSIAIADFDGDGNLDIAVANVGFNPNESGNINTVSVLYGDGTGGFQGVPVPISNQPLPAGTYPAGTSVYSIVAADVSGDGLPDIVVANNGLTDNTVTILLNTGSRTFSLQTPINVGAQHTVVGVATGDFDGDGDIDIASLNRYGIAGVDAVSIFKNQNNPASLVFHVYLSHPSTETVVVDYTTMNGTGVANVDYIPVHGQLIFAPGQTEETVLVPILDSMASGTKTVLLQLTAEGGIPVQIGTGVGTINPPPPSAPQVTAEVDGDDLVVTDPVSNDNALIQVLQVSPGVLQIVVNGQSIGTFSGFPGEVDIQSTDAYDVVVVDEEVATNGVVEDSTDQLFAQLATGADWMYM